VRTEAAFVQSALTDDALLHVVSAARSGRAVLVPHGLPLDVAGGEEGLVQLAEAIPESWTRGFDGAVKPTSGPPPAELGPVLPHERETATVTRIYHLQLSATYRSWTEIVFDPLEAAWPPHEPWVERDAGFFVTSEGAVTPAHADRHHNLLVQLTGDKEITVCVPGSRAHASVIARSLPSLYADRMPPGAEVIKLVAGFALYVPPYSVHWVRSTRSSLAMSCGWSTETTIRAGRVHAANAALRRLGVPAAPVGRRGNEVRVQAAAAARRMRALLIRD